MAVSSSHKHTRTPSHTWRRTIRHQFEGLFLVLEGPPALDLHPYGEALSSLLKTWAPSVVRVKDPGENPIAQAIDHLIQKGPEPSAIRSDSEILLRAASRTELIHNLVVPALRNKAIVLCERFLWSPPVHPGTNIRELELIRTLHRFTTDDLIPDYTFLLDQTATAYKMMSSDPMACALIDTSQSPTIVAEHMLRLIHQHFGPLLTMIQHATTAADPTVSPAKNKS